jgi:hypothetical protein
MDAFLLKILDASIRRIYIQLERVQKEMRDHQADFTYSYLVILVFAEVRARWVSLRQGIWLDSFPSGNNSSISVLMPYTTAGQDCKMHQSGAGCTRRVRYPTAE